MASFLRRRSTYMAGYTVGLLMVLGCATLGNGFDPPHISLAAIRLETVEGFESIFQVDLRLFNPNSRSLPIRGVVCDLTVDGRHLAKGVADPRTEIPAYSSAVVTVTVYASMLDMAAAAQHLILATRGHPSDQKWTYGVKGHVNLGAGIWPGRIPFASQGEFGVQDLLPPPE